VSTLAISGPVTISLTAHSLLTGGGIQNPTLVAENLKIFSSVSSAKGGLDIAGGPLVYMAVYAPNRTSTIADHLGNFFVPWRRYISSKSL